MVCNFIFCFEIFIEGTFKCTINLLIACMFKVQMTLGVQLCLDPHLIVYSSLRTIKFISINLCFF